VGNNPDPISDVRGANVGSWYAVPLRIIPDRGKRTENVAHPVIKQLCDVLHENDAGSKLANETGELEPQARTVSEKTRSLASGRNILAREPSADRVNGNSIGSKPVGGEFADVMVAGHLWPVFRQHAAGKVFDFAEGDGLETARAFKAKGKPADAAEQVKEAQLAHLHSPAAKRITHQSATLIGIAQTQPRKGLKGSSGGVMRPIPEAVLRGPFRLLPVQSAAPCPA
jgi:hypothetical protein